MFLYALHFWNPGAAQGIELAQFATGASDLRKNERQIIYELLSQSHHQASYGEKRPSRWLLKV